MSFTYCKKKDAYFVYKLTSNSSKKKLFYFYLSRSPGGLQLPNQEVYPKNLKTWENLSYKNDFIFSNLFSQSKDKAHTHCFRKFVKTSPPPLLHMVYTKLVVHAPIKLSYLTFLKRGSCFNQNCIVKSSHIITHHLELLFKGMIKQLGMVKGVVPRNAFKK